MLIKAPYLMKGAHVGQGTPRLKTSDGEDKMEESPFACDMNALSAEQRQRHVELLGRLNAAQEEVRESPDGYSIRFEAEPQLFQELAEFVIYERLCCPFFDLELVLERENG